MDKNRKIGILAMIITVVIWGISFVNIRVAVMVLPAMTLGFIRFLIASVIMFIIMIKTKTSFKIKREDLMNFIVAGGVGITAYFFFENNGVKYTTASVASLIIAAIPVFAIITESIIYKVKITKRVAICLILSIAGVLMISGVNMEEIKASGYLIGYFMMFGATITWVIYSVVSKRLFGKYEQLAIAFYQFSIGTLFFFPFIFFENVVWSDVNTEIVIHVLILGVFASAVGFFLYLIGLEKLGMGESALYINIIPLVTVLLSIFYLGESISINQILGGALVMLAVYGINSQAKHHMSEVKEYV